MNNHRRTTMTAALLVLAAASSVTVAHAQPTTSTLSTGPSNTNGYEFPDFWGDAPAQQTMTAHAPSQAGGSSPGTYDKKTSHSTLLFPPNPNG
jgi:hypothetical protein